MTRVDVTKPRTVLLLLILIVGSGLILSMIKMSETQGLPSSIPNMVNMNYLSDLRKQFVRDDNGPTVFKNSIIDMFEKDNARLSPDEPEDTPLIPSQPSTPDIGTAVGTPPENTALTVPKQDLMVLSDGPELPSDGSDPVASKSALSTSSSSEVGYGKPFATDGKDGTDGTDDDSNPVLIPTTTTTSTTTPPRAESDDPGNIATEDAILDVIAAAPNDDHPLDQTIVRMSRDGPVHVLLLTEGRSGSTWLSSFFWQHPDVFYTFEPLFQTPAWRNGGCSAAEGKRVECEVEVLSKFWSCDFLTSSLSVLGRYPNYHQDCGVLDCSMEGKQTRCAASTHRVAKTIRLWDLTHIQNIISNTPNYDVRVIHLVRDPRPLVKSRLKGGFGSLDGIHKNHDFKDETFESQCARVCKRMLETSQLGDNPPEWLKNRYVRISHEQMSLHPIETAKMLYEFVDLEWTEDNHNFIYNTTVGEIGKTGMFGIGKISTDVINQWKRMKDDQITSITEACLDTIKYLGYESDLGRIKQWKLDNTDLFGDEDNS